MAAEEEMGTRFTFGPYPDLEKLTSLKNEGYTAVVSLLHPAVVPFETQLIGEERKAAAEAGIELIHLPMLPWVSGNEQAIERARSLARSDEGRYYVHCYLGADRVRAIKRVVEQEGATTAGDLAERRLLRDRDKLERGPIVNLGPDVVVIPYPTDEEFLLLISDGFQHVVALLDPESPSDKRRIEFERDLLSQYEIEYTVIPIGSETYDPALILQAVAEAREGSRPVAIHGFLSPASGKSAVAEAFLQAWTSGKPPLPPTLFGSPMSGGQVTVVAPNVAIGPEPTVAELSRLLHPRGVRSLIYVGEGPPAELRDAAAQAGLTWGERTVMDEELLMETLSDGGPHYLFGPDAAGLVEAVRQLFGPPVPEVLHYEPGARALNALPR